jgi:hypothetical protein
VSIWPADDPTAEPDPLHCPGCGAVGDAPCASGCVYVVHAGSDEMGFAVYADAHLDEQASSDRDTDPGDAWEDIF